jgi:hypothetical protein
MAQNSLQLLQRGQEAHVLDGFGELAASIQNLNAAVEAEVAGPMPPGRSWPKRG